MSAPPERAARVPVPSAILFCCNMNAVRSPMAAAIMRHLAGRHVYVVSAGVRSGTPDPFVTIVMNEIGIDVSKHKPTSISDLHDTSFDLIVSLTPEAHHQALEFTRTMSVDVAYWPTLDPTLVSGSREQILDSYRACRDGLFRRIKRFFDVGRAPDV
jgi:protein-tyrosine-phosphatase